MSRHTAHASSDATARVAEAGDGPPEPRRQRVVAAIALTVVMLVASGRAARPLDNGDLWFHLRLGEEFRGGWQLGDPGQLTSFATQPWFARSWIPQMGLSRIHDWFGLPGVAWTYGLTLVLLVAFIYLVARRWSGTLVASLTLVLVAIAADAGLSPRPQMISFVLLVLATAGWVATIDHLRPPWWLIPTTWFWAASHGMWSTAVMVGVAVTVGLALDGRLDRTSGLRLASVPVLSIVAAALTPVGPRLVLAAVGSFTFQPYVSEFAPPRITMVPAIVAWLMIGGVVVAWLRSGQRVSWARIAVVALAALWVLYSVRSIAWGAFMIAPLFATMLQSLLDRGTPRAIGRREVTLVAALGGIVLVGLALVVPGTSTEPARVPTGLAADLDALPRGTPIYNEIRIGGWLEWRHRQLDPVIDGNTNTFSLDDFLAYRTTMDARAGWEDNLEATRARFALLDRDSALGDALAQHLGWEAIGEDAGYVLYRSPDGSG